MSHVNMFPSLNNQMKCHKRLGIGLMRSTDASHTTTSMTDKEVAAPVDRNKVDRPEGTTNSRKHTCELAVTAAKNQICMFFDQDKKKAGKKRLPCGYLTGIIDHVKKCNGLGDDIMIGETCIWQQYK